MWNIRKWAKKTAVITLTACMVMGLIPAYAEEAYPEFEDPGIAEEVVLEDTGDYELPAVEEVI